LSKENREKAAALHEQACSIANPEVALAQYHKVLALDPHRPTTLYNIGLIHKYRSEWNESLLFNRRSVELDPTDESANWNLAIAATALRDWQTAREVWKRLKLPIDDGDGSIEADFGPTPVRLNPDSNAEVVWARRIDPVRAKILNIPYPDSGYRQGDVVLHDGAAIGTREADDHEYPVFNVLELFEASKLSTYEAEVRIERSEDATQLAAALDDAGVSNQNWTTSTRMLCKQCSEGRPHEQHDHDLEREWNDRHLFGIAALEPTIVKEVISRWANHARWLIRFELKLAPLSKH
jgi:tetratricopeptide (TPR) repeat protein